MVYTAIAYTHHASISLIHHSHPYTPLPPPHPPPPCGADAGAAVSLSYGYVPQDLAQAALELAAERFRAAEHIGVRSKSLGGQETIAFDACADLGPGAGADPAVPTGGGVNLGATTGARAMRVFALRQYAAYM